MAESQKMRSFGFTIATLYTLICFLAGLASLFAFCPDDAAAAQVIPSLMVSETYDDNIFLSPTDLHGDFITRIDPGFIFTHGSSFWTWNIAYVYDYRYYANQTVTRDSTYTANVFEHTDLIDNALYMDITDVYQRVSLNVARNYAQESLFLNQSDSNIFTVNPYVNLMSGPSHTIQMGYRYVNTWYKDPTAIDTLDNVGYVVMGTPLSSNTTITGGIQYTRDVNSIRGYFKTDIYTGPVYTYASGSSAFCYLGETWLRFADFSNIHHLLWDIGFNHHYSTMTLRVETKTDYVPDPYFIIRRVDQLEATLTRESSTRTSFSGLLGWYEYRNAATDHLETTAYTVSGQMRHVLTPRSTFTGEISNTIYHDYILVADTYVYQITTRFEHNLLPDLIVAGQYIYTYAYSPDIYSQNSRDNNISVELTKRF